MSTKIKTTRLLLLSLMTFALFFAAPTPVSADHPSDTDHCIEETGSPGGNEVEQCLSQLRAERSASASSGTGAPTPTGTLTPTDLADNPIYTRLNEIVRVLSIGVGIVVTMSIVFAGFQFMFSRGDSGKTQAAINRLIQAGIALFLYIFGTAILNWLIPGGIFI